MQSVIIKIPKQRSLKNKMTLKEGINSKMFLMLFKDVCKDFFTMLFMTTGISINLHEVLSAYEIKNNNCYLFERLFK